jgi:hypothetical protein
MSEQSTDQLSKQLKEIDELNRVVSNGLNWLAELDVKVAHIQPVAEFIGFLNGLKGNIAKQREALVAVMPKNGLPTVSAVTGETLTVA